MTSTWVLRDTPNTNDEWSSVTYGNGLFVAVSNLNSVPNTGRVMTSPDGITWTPRPNTPSQANTWSSVTYGNGLFVAVSSLSSVPNTNRVMTSPDGITWSLIPNTPSPANNWISVTFVNGLFVAVSRRNSMPNTDRVMTSPDGITWTLRTNTPSSANTWRSVTYGNGLFVAVSSLDSWPNTPNTDRVMTSPDGIVWTLRTNTPFLGGWFGVTYGNGLFVAVGARSAGEFNGNVMTSPDGIDWTLRSISYTSYYYEWNSVTYGNGLFVAVGSYSFSSEPNLFGSMTSSNGIDWDTGNTPTTTNAWKSVTYALDLFVAVSNSGPNTTRAMTNGTLSCYNKGTKILCLIDDLEVYVPIENIQKGVLVKTYKHGYLPVELIGKRTAITSPNNQEIKRLYKQKGGELTVTGGHYLLVDELPDGLNHFVYSLNYMIEDKKILLACDSELFEAVNEVRTSELYHLVLETGAGKDKHYGIYADGVLSESTTKQHYLMCGFEDL